MNLPVAKRKPGTLARREALAFYLFVSPWIIGFLVFLVYPLISSLYFSLTRYTIATTPVWIGLDNFISSFKNPRFFNSLWITIRFAVISIPGVTVVALGLALLLSQKLKGINFFRTVYFMPSVMPSSHRSGLYPPPESGPWLVCLLWSAWVCRLLSERASAPT
jgi:multiple sugar transport system permease protein